ncbi:MAG: MFS transporter [Anaerolineaceae bacterium]|nr:MFS transporter [Anaerolineaceae bacterium]
MMENKVRNRILVVLFIGVLMGALDIAIVGPALPSIKETFTGINERSLAWLFSIYVLFNLVSTPIMAKLSDIFGRKTIYILDVSLFATGSVLVALSGITGFWLLLVGRAVQGLGAGGIFPVASAVIGDTFPAEKRGSALGLIGAVFGLAFLVGPILGGVILSFASWEWLFLINIPIAVVVIALSIKILPGRTNKVTPSLDLPGMGVLVTLLASLTFGLNQIDTARFFASLLSWRVLPFLTYSVLALIVLIAIERKAANPILSPELFKSRQLRIGYLLSAGAGLGEASLVFMPLLAVAALGVKQNQASFLLMPVVLAMAVGSPTAGRLLDRLGSKVVIISGTATLAIGVFLLSQFASSMTLYIIAGALIGLGLSALLGAPIRYITLNEVSAEQRSTAQGVVTVFTSVGQLVSAASVGAVAASMGGGVAGYSAAFLVISIIAVVMVAGAFLLKNRTHEVATMK